MAGFNQLTLQLISVRFFTSSDTYILPNRFSTVQFGGRWFAALQLLVGASERFFPGDEIVDFSSSFSRDDRLGEISFLRILNRENHLFC